MKFHNKRVSILSDPSMITMLTNDFGYDKTCEKFLEYYVEKDTLAIIMSSGGESKNMLNALKWCEKENTDYGVLTGFKEDNTIRKSAKKALWNYYINSNNYGVVECVHQIFLHGVV
jgi:D-sedoheptulose 7-phosphate isomerase